MIVMLQPSFRELIEAWLWVRFSLISLPSGTDA